MGASSKEEKIRKELIQLIMDKIGVRENEILPDADIEHDLGCTGDDFDELIQAYAKRLNVDMTGYVWYFHAHEESMATVNPILGNPPSQQVERIPITLDLLVDKALLGRWDIRYPIHSLRPRYTLWDKTICGLFILLLIFFMIRSCM